MPIRLSALLALATSACGFPSTASTEDAPVLSETSEPIINTCDPIRYPCDPFDRFANGICQFICGGDGYCLEYTAVEYAWCATHPDKAFAPGHLCSPSGDPLWQTHCAPGFLP